MDHQRLYRLITEAKETLAGTLNPTPLVYSSSLSEMLGFESHLKLENLQKTGSFKGRGAYNKISSLTEDERSRGVVTVSSGNHAQGVAWASRLLGARSTVVMPSTTPIIKQVATRGYGAEVVLHGEGLAEAEELAEELAREKGFTFVHPYDDELIMAGQGTVGVEIAEELPEVDSVVVPVGGGGLISGVAAALKGAGKTVRVIGAEPAAVSSAARSIQEGRPVESLPGMTIADGVAVKGVGERPFGVIKDLVDRVATVGEDSIAAGILLFLERKKLVVEGAGAVGLAAGLEGGLEDLRGGRVVFVVSGGNIDVTALDRVLRLGLLREGRLVRFSTVVDDVPGSLASLTAVIAGLKANILYMTHQRVAVDVPVGKTRLDVIVEVEGKEHGEQVLGVLDERGYELSEGGLSGCKTS